MYWRLILYKIQYHYFSRDYFLFSEDLHFGEFENSFLFFIGNLQLYHPNPCFCGRLHRFFIISCLKLFQRLTSKVLNYWLPIQISFAFYTPLFTTFRNVQLQPILQNCSIFFSFFFRNLGALINLMKSFSFITVLGFSTNLLVQEGFIIHRQNHWV